ncbi:hypothetical protein [Sphingopyxis terrae]|uniref:hypothetical protein n=1 Tax=Sphingopyxis terrae TaxID=33052 RepID=UPI003F7E11CE
MQDILLERIEAFLKEADMPPSVFGRAAVHDPRLVSDLRGGRICGRAVICRAEHFMNKWRDDFRAGRVTPIGDRRAGTRAGGRVGSPADTGRRA